MVQAFNLFVFQPIYNGLIFLYNIIPGHDLGIAIIFLTIFVRIILYPLSQKQIESQRKLQAIQPEVKEIQEKYKKDKEKQSRALMELYKEKKANPAAGCLPLVAQIIVFIALFQVFMAGLNFSSECKDLYSFIKCPESLKTTFLGILELTKPSLVLAAIAAAGQYIQTKMMMGATPAAPKKNDISSMMSTQMLYLGPILTFFMGAKFPSGLALYWVVNTLFGIYQQHRTLGKKMEVEKAA